MNVTVKTNIGQVAARLHKRFISLQDKDKLLRTIATSLLPEVKHRIHVEGKAADGSEIGTYKDSYMPTRIKFNRGDSRKKIYSLTSQMENSFVVIADGVRYGLGFIDIAPDSRRIGKSISSSQKVKYNEGRDGKKVYALTGEEIQTGRKVALQFISDALHR